MTAAVIIVGAWNTGLLVALWIVASRLHEHMHLGVTPIGQIMRHWCLGMGLFVALLSPWPQAVVIAAVALSVFVTWGALLSPAGEPGPQPQALPRDAWEQVSGGMSKPMETE